MPNYCYNTIKITSFKKNFIDNFIKKHIKVNEEGDEFFDFNTIIAEPKTKEKCAKKYICDPKEEHIEAFVGREWFNWYKWRYDKWNTKWNSFDLEIERTSDSHLIIRFNTAWNEPSPIFQALVNRYFYEARLLFEYQYEGEDEVYKVRGLPSGF